MTHIKESEHLKTLVTNILTLAKKQGASACEVNANFSDGFSVDVRMGEIETIEYQRDKEVDIIVYFDKRKGSVGTTDTSPKAIEQALEKACRIAKFVNDDPYNGLADKSLMATTMPDLSLYHPWDINANDAAKLAIQCETIARNHDQRIKNSDGFSVSSYKGSGVYGNSHGFIGVTESTRHDISGTLIAESNGLMERDGEYTISRDPNDLAAIDFVAKRAAEKTVKRLDARKIKTCKVPVIFSAELARGLLGCLIGAIAGSSLYRKSSFLLDQLNKPIFANHIHIHEDPFLLKGMGSSVFDGDGVATYKKDFVRDGILESYCLSDYSAKRLGMKTTANAGGVHNLIINHGDKNLNQLIKTMDKGLLVTDLMGQGVNLITGDYSRGAFGYWVENGEIQYPVHEITIANNLKNMFQQIIEVGNDVDCRGNVRTGSMLLEEMIIAGS